MNEDSNFANDDALLPCTARILIYSTIKYGRQIHDTWIWILKIHTNITIHDIRYDKSLQRKLFNGKLLFVLKSWKKKVLDCISPFFHVQQCNRLIFFFSCLRKKNWNWIPSLLFHLNNKLNSKEFLTNVVRYKIKIVRFEMFLEVNETARFVSLLIFLRRNLKGEELQRLFHFRRFSHHFFFGVLSWNLETNFNFLMNSHFFASTYTSNAKNRNDVQRAYWKIVCFR